MWGYRSGGIRTEKKWPYDTDHTERLPTGSGVEKRKNCGETQSLRGEVSS